MKINPRRIFDFIMGGCSGFCFFYGSFIGYATGTLLLISFIIKVIRPEALKAIDESLKGDEKNNK